MKRNVLASFTDVLLLPVTIVPRTVGVVGAGLTTAGSAAVQGISMLNPQRWVNQNTNGVEGYSKHLGVDEKDATLFEMGEEEDEATAVEDLQEKRGMLNLSVRLFRHL